MHLHPRRSAPPCPRSVSASSPRPAASLPSVYPGQALAKIRAAAVTTAMCALCFAGLVLVGYAIVSGGAR